MSWLHAWKALPPLDRQATLAAFSTLPTVRLGLLLFGYRRCHRWLQRQPMSAPRDHDAQTVARACGAAVDRVARRLPGGASCLPRSLCLVWLLRQRGIPTELKIGVRKSPGGTIEGHAWVELHGDPINDAANISESFAPFEGASLPEISRIAP